MDMREQMELTKDGIKNIKKTIKESRNHVTTEPLNYQKSQLEYNLKMQKIIYTQITNYTALK